jgi:hypothetical protein
MVFAENGHVGTVVGNTQFVGVNDEFVSWM